MKSYPTIEYWNKGIWNEYVYGFEKIDGSNFRVLWNRKNSKKTKFTNGFIRFGTRTQIINNVRQPFGDGVEIFDNIFAIELNDIFYNHEYFKSIDNITVFLEYKGENSFAGFHNSKDKKELIMFDVWRDRKGFVPPKIFLEIFKDFNIPELIYQGFYTQELVQDVFNNKYNLDEGLVCKGVKKVKNGDDVWMTKIKTKEWLQKVKDKFGKDTLLKEVNNDKEICTCSLMD